MWQEILPVRVRQDLLLNILHLLPFSSWLLRLSCFDFCCFASRNCDSACPAISKQSTLCWMGVLLRDDNYPAWEHEFHHSIGSGYLTQSSRQWYIVHCRSLQFHASGCIAMFPAQRRRTEPSDLLLPETQKIHQYICHTSRCINCGKPSASVRFPLTDRRSCS